MSDLIKREDAIEAIDTMICDNKWVCECAINSLLSVNEWIPVSESLPKKEEYVLASVTAPDRNYDIVIIKGVDVERYSEFISAWQPLPTPYKESEVEE